MNAQTETKMVVVISEVMVKTENPMQERYCGQVAESVEITAEAVFLARSREVRNETGPVFIP